MKLAFVTPRYGTEVVGGAELGARMLAERLVAEAGWDVEVVTTCALDTRTWADELPAGEADVNGVRVRRFPSESGRDPRFERFSEEVINAPWATPAQKRRWFELQGPVNPAVVEAAAASDADVVACYPYLYLPIIEVIERLGRRTVLHPAAHDEPPLRVPFLRRVFNSVGGLVFQTWSERALVEERCRVASVPQTVVGLGVEEHEGEPSLVPDRPYLLYVGRVDHMKGTSTLARFFAEYKARRPGPLALVLAGPVIDEPPAHPDVIVTGPVSDEAKWGLLRGATAFVNPSGFEAFSIVLVEAWTAGVPVVVNGRCGATREHCERSGGGLWFERYAELEAVLDRLLGDDHLRAGLAANGAAYVEREFRWPVIVERYARFLTQVAERAR